MSESNSLPQSISHKKLSYLMLNAQKDKSFGVEENVEFETEREHFQIAINNWHESTIELLKKVSSKNENYLKNKSSNSLMALGAMEVHLNMALQALKAFNNDENK